MRILRRPSGIASAGALVVSAICAFAIAHASSGVGVTHRHLGARPLERRDQAPSRRALGDQSTFGPVCGDNSNGARSYWPSQDANGPGYVYYDPYIGKNVGGNIRGHVAFDRKTMPSVGWSAATTAGTSPARRSGRYAWGAASTRTARPTRSARITGTASAPTARSTAPISPMSGRVPIRGTSSSGD